MATQGGSPAHSAHVVGNAFVGQYYHFLLQSPRLVHRFYHDFSLLGRPDSNGGMTIVTTMQAINDKILSLKYEDYTAEIETVDAQESYEKGVIVLVTGCLTGKDNERKKFTQSFFLAPQEKGYFVLNDVFRYVEESELLQINSRSRSLSLLRPSFNIPAPQMATQEGSPAPSAQVVGHAFVEQYYHILHQSPGLVHRFYQDSSLLSRPDSNGGMITVTTMQAINGKILSLKYEDYTAEIKTVDAQESYEKGVIVLVTGCLTGKDNVRKKFTQSFFLAPQEKGYFVLNDVYRYVEESELLQIYSDAVNSINETVFAADVAQAPQVNWGRNTLGRNKSKEKLIAPQDKGQSVLNDVLRYVSASELLQTNSDAVSSSINETASTADVTQALQVNLGEMHLRRNKRKENLTKLTKKIARQ